MSIKTAKPSTVLQPYIKQYWGIENVLLDGEKHIQRIIPSGLPDRFNFSRINHAINIISQARGKISIENLASETCLSRKQFERKFSELIGITPKQYLKTIRLQYSLFLKSRKRKLNITDLAYEVGYYDQAHFINDFKSQTGYTPKQYFDNNSAYSDFFES